MKKDILGFNNEKIGEIDLKKDLIADDLKTGSLYYKIINENANIHLGNAFKKTRATVSGGGRKPYRQKGTGRARQGSIRAPHYRKGGNAFGGQRKVYKFKLPEKIKKNALIILFNIKFRQNLITIIDDIKLNTPRVKDIVNLLEKIVNLKKERINLIVLDKDDNLNNAVKNIKNVNLIPLKRIKLVSLLNSNKIFITQSAMKFINEIKG